MRTCTVTRTATSAPQEATHLLTEAIGINHDGGKDGGVGGNGRGRLGRLGRYGAGVFLAAVGGAIGCAQ